MIKLLKYLRPFATIVGFILALVLVQALADLYLPTLMADIVDVGVVQNNIDYIWRVGGFMLLVAAGSAASSIVANFLSAQTASGFGRNLRTRVFSHVTGFSLAEFDKLGTATLITRTTNDISQVQQVLIMVLRIMIYAPLLGIGGIFMAVALDAELSLVLVVVVPLLIGLIAIISIKAVPLFRAMQLKLDRVNLVLRENLTGIRVIRAFNREQYERVRFDDANRDLTNTAIRVNRLMAFVMPLVMILMNLTSVAIIWFGGIRISNGGMQVGALIAFLQYAMQIMFSVLMLSFLLVMIPRAQASAVRINEVLDMLPEINDPASPKNPVLKRGSLEFRDVTFSYPGAEAPAISNISFSARAGEVIAIIGGTGSGKSTLINLIPRFYDIDSGSILVDGVDVREVEQESLRSRIGLVPQQAVLFSGTITDNIKFGKEDASSEEIESAAETAQALEFISTMEGGFDSLISQGGTNVSGGQKQRLAIARALIRHPEIYLFDDSFSALDFKTDAKLRSALRKVTTDSTVIIVAQRVSTVLDADQILVLDDGRIVGSGKHKELLKTSEVYREIVASQLSEEELAA
ncbi:MAG TPA: ABC transporter ATP-binding protein [Chloroflexia bacterium]|nr:ABC transporter ATP-binding protein [Chloroflexia bacterium]